MNERGIHIVLTDKGGEQREVRFPKAEVTIGRVQGNDIVLPRGNVSKRHARVVAKDGRIIAVDLKSTNGTFVNGRKLTSPLVLKSGDKLYIGDFILNVELDAPQVQQPSHRAIGAGPIQPQPPVAPQPIAQPPQPVAPPPQPTHAPPPPYPVPGAEPAPGHRPQTVRPPVQSVAPPVPVSARPPQPIAPQPVAPPPVAPPAQPPPAQPSSTASAQGERRASPAHSVLEAELFHRLLVAAIGAGNDVDAAVALAQRALAHPATVSASRVISEGEPGRR